MANDFLAGFGFEYDKAMEYYAGTNLLPASMLRFSVADADPQPLRLKRESFIESYNIPIRGLVLLFNQLGSLLCVLLLVSWRGAMTKPTVHVFEVLLFVSLIVTTSYSLLQMESESYAVSAMWMVFFLLTTTTCTLWCFPAERTCGEFVWAVLHWSCLR